MKRILFVLLCVTVCQMQAQRVSRQYKNVSMAEALKDLNCMQSRYIVNFIYNDLEDFRVTAQIKNQTVPEAIRQIIDIYPVRMIQEENVLLVECTHITKKHLSGTVVDENGQPLPFVNILVMAPEDSAVVSGGVSDGSGVFVIPYEPAKVLVKISYVGYKTLWRTCTAEDMGRIQMHPSSQMLRGVTVKAMRPQFRMAKGGVTVDVENSLLSKLGTAEDVLDHLPRVSVKEGEVKVFAKGTPLIYINGKKVTDKTELEQLKSENIKTVSIITSPGAEYDATAEAVIRITTKAPKADGWSVVSSANGMYNGMRTGNAYNETKYHTGKLEVFNKLFFNDAVYHENNDLNFHILGNDVEIKQHSENSARTNTLSETVGGDYALNDSNSVGGSYNFYKDLSNNGNFPSQQTITKAGVLEGVVNSDGTTNRMVGPRHQADIYYVGKIGKWGVDFNGSYLQMRYKESMNTYEQSEELEDRPVNSLGKQHSHMVAGKLVLSCPVWRGSLSFGSEYTHTNSAGEYRNVEEYVASSETNIKESNIAGFAQYSVDLGNISLDAGLRYEHVKSDYYSFGVREAEPSRNYENIFPNLSASWNKGKWGLQVDYSIKTHRPNYRSLRNFMQYDNRYLFEGGNPSLRPEKVHCIEASATYSWLSCSAGYRYVKDAMTWTTTRYNNQDILYMSNRNFSHQGLVYASAELSPKFGIYQPTFEADYSQQFFRADGMLDGRNLNKACFAFKLNNRFQFNKTLMATLGISTSTKEYSGFMVFKPNAVVNASLRKSCCKDALVFLLKVNDIFKGDKELWTMYGEGNTTTKDSYNYSRSVSLTVTYNFNATRSKYKGTGAGSDEKRRL